MRNQIKRDLTGERFGKLLVMGWVPKAVQVTKKSGRLGWQGRWKCKCDCGKETLKRLSSLNGGFARTCGCGVEKRVFPMIGKRFGKLLVISQGESKRYPYKRHRHMRTWHCDCDCGKKVLCTTNQLMHDRKSSCGCGNKPKDLKYIRDGLAKHRVAQKAVVFENLRSSLEASGVKLLTPFSVYGTAKNYMGLRLQAVCEKGHEFDATWPQFHQKRYCRKCRRINRDALRRETTELLVREARIAREKEKRRMAASASALTELAEVQGKIKKAQRAAEKQRKIKMEQDRRMFEKRRLASEKKIGEQLRQKQAQHDSLFGENSLPIGVAG